MRQRRIGVAIAFEEGQQPVDDLVVADDGDAVALGGGGRTGLGVGGPQGWIRETKAHIGGCTCKIRAKARGRSVGRYFRELPGQPLAGKTVAVVHAAWHSCGSYQVNVSQIAAYRALGARVLSIAMMDAHRSAAPSTAPLARLSRGDAATLARTAAFIPARRFPRSPPALLVDGWWRLIHGDQASWLIELAKRAPLPEGLEERIDRPHPHQSLFHAALRRDAEARAACPVLLETQDIQARQYVLRNKGGFFIPPYATYDDMLQIELDWMRRADLCVASQRGRASRLPAAAPGGAPCAHLSGRARVAAARADASIIIVASDNYANYLSLRWFLQRGRAAGAGGARVAIYGNIDSGVKSRDRRFTRRIARCFKGRVDDIGAVYANAGCVLLPTVEGHGLSIKAVEALSCGAPLVATPLAFRGMQVDPTRALAMWRWREEAEQFAAALARRAGSGRPGRDAATRQRDTRRLYEEAFSPQAYARTLGEQRVLETLLRHEAAPSLAGRRVALSFRPGTPAAPIASCSGRSPPIARSAPTFPRSPSASIRASSRLA